MDRKWSILVGCLALLAWAAPALSQQPSLAEIARQEKERRAAIDNPAPVFTNADLEIQSHRVRVTAPRGATSEQPVAPAPPDEGDRRDASATPQTSPVIVTTSEPERGESYWRDRLFAADEARRRADVVAAALQNRVDGLWADFSARDDPYQRSVIEQQRVEAIEWLQRTQATVERLEQEIAEIHEDARRADVPPGWLRAK